MGTCPHRALRDGQIPPIQDDDTEVLGQRPPPRPAASCSDCRGYLPVRPPAASQHQPRRSAALTWCQVGAVTEDTAANFRNISVS